jgi:hypothetical protein
VRLHQISLIQTRNGRSAGPQLDGARNPVNRSSGGLSPSHLVGPVGEGPLFATSTIHNGARGMFKWAGPAGSSGFLLNDLMNLTNLTPLAKLIADCGLTQKYLELS